MELKTLEAAFSLVETKYMAGQEAVGNDSG